jgi:hypothetical protein
VGGRQACGRLEERLSFLCLLWGYLTGAGSLGGLDRAAKRPIGESLLGREHLLIGAVAHEDGADGHAEDLHEHTRHEVGQEEGDDHRADDACDLIAHRVDQGEVAKEGRQERDADLRRRVAVAVAVGGESQTRERDTRDR